MSEKRMVRALLVSTLCCMALPAYASTASEMHRTRAISLIGEGQLEQARTRLEQAVLADENDQHARYYRGIVHSRLGNYEMAASDLKAAMLAPLPYQNLHFELGYAEFHREQMTAAKDALQVAVQQNPSFAPAQYYLGVALYQLKEYEACLSPLEQASKLEPEFDAAASFMRGDAQLYLKRRQEAEATLTAAIETHPDSIYTEYARKTLERLELERRQERRWELELATSGSYDSNVGLFADDRALPAGIEDKKDGRAQFSLDGRYALWQDDNQGIDVGYRFFQSKHKSLGDYDMQNHTLSADYRQEREQYVWGVNIQYVLSRLGGEAYRNRGLFSPYLMWEHDQAHTSFFKLQLGSEKYQQALQESRDGTTYEGQYRHYWLLGTERHNFLGMRLNADESKLGQYSFKGQGIDGGLQHRWDDFTLNAELLYQSRKYAGGVPSRRDSYTKGDIKLSHPLQASLDLEGNLSLIKNNSTNDNYDYNRYVVNLMLRWRL